VLRGHDDAAAGCTLFIASDGKSAWQFIDPAGGSMCDNVVVPPHPVPPHPGSTGLHVPAGAFAIRTTDSSGLGAFASHNIKKGECILSESPLVQWTLQASEKTTAGLVSLVNALPQGAYEEYCSLCQNPMHGSGPKSLYGIWLSNAYPCTSPMQALRDRQSGMEEEEIERTKAVFASACRFNHSCSPNAHASWNAQRGQQVIYALCDIARGAEIGVSYLENACNMRRAQRHEQLGFTCKCPACDVSGLQLAQSDQRRGRTGAIFAMLEPIIRAADKRAVALVSERLDLMKLESMREEWNTLFCAASYFALAGDARQASRWAAQAADSARHGLGSDSDEFQHYAACAARWHARCPMMRG